MFEAFTASEAVQTKVGLSTNRGLRMAKGDSRSKAKAEVQAVQRRWLQEVCDAKQLEPSILAQGAGVSASTLTRILNDPDYTGTLSVETIQRIKDKYRVPGPEEYGGGRRTGILLGLSEAARFDLRKEKGELARIVEAILRGRDHIEPWRLKTMALDGVGYLPGDIVFVERISDGAGPKPQDAVCAQVFDYQHGSAETVWRVYDPPFLVAAATDRTGYKPLLVDGERVKLAGVIRESYRPHSLSATR